MSRIKTARRRKKTLQPLDFDTAKDEPWRAGRPTQGQRQVLHRIERERGRPFVGT